MTSPFVSLAISLVRVWTRLYTWRLPSVVHEARRAEIDSDLWEFERDSADVGTLRSAAQVVARLAIGIPDDLFWRAEHTSVNSTLIRRTAVCAAAAVVITMVWVVAAFQRPEVPQLPTAKSLQWKRALGPAPPPPPPPPPPSCLPPGYTAGCGP